MKSELSGVLAELERYCDKVNLVLHPGLRWRCYGELRIRVTGGSFEIKSENQHAGPLPAAQEMLERVEECLKDIHRMSAATPLNSPARALEGQ